MDPGRKLRGRGRQKGDPQTLGPTCGAKKRTNGEPCKRPAGYKTKHLGEGRCHLHGGATPLTTGTRTKLKDPKNILNSLKIVNLPSLELIYGEAEKQNVVETADIEKQRVRANLISFAIELSLMTKPGDDGGLVPLTVQEMSDNIQRSPEAMELLKTWTLIGSRIEEKAARIRALDATFTAEDVLAMGRDFARLIAKYVPEDQQKALMTEIKNISFKADNARDNRALMLGT